MKVKDQKKYTNTNTTYYFQTPTVIIIRKQMVVNAKIGQFYLFLQTKVDVMTWLSTGMRWTVVTNWSSIRRISLKISKYYKQEAMLSLLYSIGDSFSSFPHISNLMKCLL
jgi:hypothetical protein